MTPHLAELVVMMSAAVRREVDHVTHLGSNKYVVCRAPQHTVLHNAFNPCQPCNAHLIMTSNQAA